MGSIIFQWGFNSGACLRIPELGFYWGVLLFEYIWLFYTRDVAVLVNTTYLIGCYDLMLIQPWIKVMHCSLLWLTLQIRVGIDVSHLSIPVIVTHGRCYISQCFVLCVCAFLTVCRVVLVFSKCVMNQTSFLFKSRFISLLLFIHLFFTFFFSSD